MARIHLVIGPVGAGKSTFARELCRAHSALRLTLDEWMTGLFSPDRPDSGVPAWYMERAARCVEQIWKVTRSALEAGTDVVLEIGLIQKRDRQQLYRRVAEGACALTMYVLDAPRDVRRERILQRNREKGHTFSMVVPPAIFEMASDLWEPPEEAECHGRDVRFIATAE
jgi:predicted kinase